MLDFRQAARPHVRRSPVSAGAAATWQPVVPMREAFVALNDLVIVRLADRGHAAVRPAHGAVFQFLDDTGPPSACSPNEPR